MKQLYFHTLLRFSSPCLCSVCFAPCVLVMLCGCNYAAGFIVQTCIPIKERTHRCPRWKSGRAGARGSPCHQAHFQSRLAAHYNIGFPLSCHYHTLSLKADPKDRQSIRRESSHLYLLNVLMSSIFRPRRLCCWILEQRWRSVVWGAGLQDQRALEGRGRW